MRAAVKRPETEALKKVFTLVDTTLEASKELLEAVTAESNGQMDERQKVLVARVHLGTLATRKQLEIHARQSGLQLLGGDAA